MFQRPIVFYIYMTVLKYGATLHCTDNSHILLSL